MDVTETDGHTSTWSLSTSSSPSTSSAPAATQTLQPFTGFSLPDILITIDNNTFYQLLPGQTSNSMILSDGTTASITDQTVELTGASLSIPSSNDLSQSGGAVTKQLGPWTVEFSTRKFQQTAPACGSNKYNCFKQAAQYFIQSAESLTDSLGKVGASMVLDGIYTAWDLAGLVAEASPYATTAESISGRIGSLLSPLEDAIEGLDGAMSAVNENLASFEEYEMQELSNINKNIFPAYPTLRPALGSLQNINRILQLAIQNPTGSLLTIAKNRYVQMTAGVGLMSLTTLGLDQITTTDLNSMKTSPNKTVESQDIRLHYIKFEPNFPLLLFNTMTKMLDEDAGVKTAADPVVNALGPGYTTELAVGPTKLMKYLPFISFIYLHPSSEEMQDPDCALQMFFWDDLPLQHSRGLPLLSRNISPHNKRFYMEGPGFWHQEAMSWQKGMVDSSQMYRRDESEGQGVTIFMLDSGFSLGSKFNGVCYYFFLRCINLVSWARPKDVPY